MNKERLMKLILAPIVSEKSSTVGDKNNQHVFKVRADAKKNEIKAAIEMLFNVKVSAVNTINMKGRMKHFRGVKGTTKSYKKAYVTLSGDDRINMVENMA